jgi:hypothetical protein
MMNKRIHREINTFCSYLKIKQCSVKRPLKLLFSQVEPQFMLVGTLTHETSETQFLDAALASSHQRAVMSSVTNMFMGLPQISCTKYSSIHFTI